MKNYVIIFIISTMILSSVTVVALLLLLPKQNIEITGEQTEKYEKLDKSEYLFTQNKEIPSNIVINYSISQNKLSNFKNYNYYDPGNKNPFSSEIDVYNAGLTGNSGSGNNGTGK